jgi:hypothetical protein
MGKYINEDSKGKHIGTTFHQKLGRLIDDGAFLIEPPSITGFKDGLVCLVDNGHFAAAGYAYDQIEMEVFLQPDERKKQWLLIEHVSKIAQ